MKNHNNELENEVNRDSLSLLYSNGLGGILITFLAASGLAFGFEKSVNDDFKLFWWIVLCILLSLRLSDVLFWYYSIKKSALYNLRLGRIRFIAGTLGTALWWSIYCFYVSSDVQMIELASMIVVVSAMAGGGATILAASKLTTMLYATILLCPFSIALVTSSENHRVVLGALGLGFCLVMVITGRKSAIFTRHAIYLKHENAILVNHMEQQVEQRAAKIYELSNIDPLTGLFNREAFSASLSTQLERRKNTDEHLALLFIDLDGFKKINDMLGHDIGDQVLMQSSKRIKKQLLVDNLLCRWGGDEFLIAMPNVSEEQALNYAHFLISSISNVYELDNNRLYLGATIGIALYPKHAQNERELIQLADTTMYHQKKTKAGTAAVFNAKIGNQLIREHKLKQALSEAIIRQEMQVVYQPIVCAELHTTKACEALLRWNLDGESIPPDEFILLAEQGGQIIKIGTWVLYEACRTAAGWEHSMLKAPDISVNVSVIQLLDDNFLTVVNKILAETGLSAEKLFLEITESFFSADKDKMFNQIKALQSRGIKVSIDDFGTGYSSLSVMQDLAFNTVKIDRAFVQKIESSGFAIIKAVAQIAKTMHCSIVAEGVETKEQAKILQSLGVDSLQGFYFSKPLDKEKTLDFICQKSKIEAINQAKTKSNI